MIIGLKDKFTQRWKYSHYLLTPMPMERHENFCGPAKKNNLQHAPKQLRMMETCYLHAF